MPATFGLPIFQLGTDGEKDGAGFARVTERLTIVLVSNPTDVATLPDSIVNREGVNGSGRKNG